MFKGVRLAFMLAGVVGVAGEVSASNANQASTSWGFDLTLNESFGPSRMMFLDDPMFGPPLGGGTAGLTQSLSTFAEPFAFGYPILGMSTTEFILQVPGPRDGAGNPQRGLGLIVYPRLGTDTTVEEWTFAMDLVVPLGTWPIVNGPLALINFDDNNGDDADLFLLPPQGANNNVRIGTKTQSFATPLLQVNTWMRIAIKCDNPNNKTKIYINGIFIGTVNQSWALRDQVDPNDPRYRDGTQISPDDWGDWGEFPNPWETSPFPLNSSFTLFSDDNGEGGPVGVGNIAIIPDYPTDDPWPGCLDEPDSDEIMLCPADIDGACGVTIGDLLFFLSQWFTEFGYDFNCDGQSSILDLLEYLGFWFGGC